MIIIINHISSVPGQIIQHNSNSPSRTNKSEEKSHGSNNKIHNTIREGKNSGTVVVIIIELYYYL